MLPRGKQWFTGWIHPAFLRWLRRWVGSKVLAGYLSNHPDIRAHITLEIDHPAGAESGVWLNYDYWPQEWKGRVLEHFLALREDEPLPLEPPLPLGLFDPMHADRLCYRTVEHARDTYFAQVAHALWLETSHVVPWSLGDWSASELTYLLSSKVHFAARQIDSALHYVVHIGGVGDATGSILHDPRKALEFMQCEPEQGRCLIGPTPAETCVRLTEWFHDYLRHNPGGFDTYAL